MRLGDGEREVRIMREIDREVERGLREVRKRQREKKEEMKDPEKRKASYEEFLKDQREWLKEVQRRRDEVRGHGKGFTLRIRLSRWSLRENIISKVCPLCGNGLPDGKLEWHHWGTKHEGEADELGKCRRMCRSCNRILGIGVTNGGLGKLWRKGLYNEEMFTDRMTWERQKEFLYSYYRDKDKKERYPNFDGIEKDWSRLTSIEEEIYRKIIGRSSYGEE